MIDTEITHVARDVLELVGILSLPVIGAPLMIFAWSLRFSDEDEDWTVNLAVSLKIGGLFLLIAVSLILNAAGDKIWFLMRAERLWGLYVILLVTGTASVLLVSWFRGRRFRGIQPLNELAAADGEPESCRNRMPIVASSISLVIGWLVAIVWLWSISKGP